MLFRSEVFTKTLGDTLMNVNFTGGEPFARKDIVDIGKAYIDNSSIQSIYITTNGSLPDRAINFCKEINKYNSDIETVLSTAKLGLKMRKCVVLLKKRTAFLRKIKHFR